METDFKIERRNEKPTGKAGPELTILKNHGRKQIPQDFPKEMHCYKCDMSEHLKMYFPINTDHIFVSPFVDNRYLNLNNRINGMTDVRFSWSG